MDKVSKPNVLHPKKLWGYALAMAAGGLVLAGCGGETKAATTTSTLRTTSSTTLKDDTELLPPANIDDPETPMLVFDYLNGNSKVIRVYPGVSDSKADHIANGTFYDGESVPAECKTEGRHLESVPPETPYRESNMWIRIQGTPGEIQYATAVYTKEPDKLLAQLPHC